MSRPTHNLCVKRKEDSKDRSIPFVQIGVGWKDERGTIRIRLDPGASLRWTDELMISLFETGYNEEEDPRKSRVVAREER